MNKPAYFAPHGGHPEQTQLLTDRAIVSGAYTVIPRGALQDIVTNQLPFWNATRVWVLAKPIQGFSTTFCQYIMEVSHGGGSELPEPDAGVEGVLFVMDGKLDLVVDAIEYQLSPGGYAFLPPGCNWSVKNNESDPVRFHWIRKAYEFVQGIDLPEVIVANENDLEPSVMPHSEGKWATTRFVDPADMRHDMHATIVTFEPGAVIPFLETHVMEHGLYILEGKAAYRLNQDWVEVQAGDFIWLRAFCPQACYAGGPGKFRYLLYKDVNRHMKL